MKVFLILLLSLCLHQLTTLPVLKAQESQQNRAKKLNASMTKRLKGLNKEIRQQVGETISESEKHSALDVGEAYKSWEKLPEAQKKQTMIIKGKVVSVCDVCSCTLGLVSLKNIKIPSIYVMADNFNYPMFHLKDKVIYAKGNFFLRENRKETRHRFSPLGIEISKQ